MLGLGVKYPPERIWPFGYDKTTFTIGPVLIVNGLSTTQFTYNDDTEHVTEPYNKSDLSNSFVVLMVQSKHGS